MGKYVTTIFQREEWSQYQNYSWQYHSPYTMMNHIIEGGVNQSLDLDTWQGELLAFDQVRNVFQ